MPSTRNPSGQKPTPRKQPAREPASEKAVARKTVAKKAVAKPKAVTKNAASRRSHRRERPPATEQHRRAVAAVQQMFHLYPLDAARWILQASSKGREPCEVVEARWIEQAPRGPAYVVPPPRVEEEVPSTPEALLGRLLKSTIEREAAESKGEIETVDLDLGESMRQTLAEGGSEVELWLRVKVGKRAPFDTLLGVTLPDEHDDGAEMAWTVLRKTSWHLLAYEQIAGERTPSFQTVPLYLWPGTGLADPQESCSVSTGEPTLPGFLGALLAARDEKQRARERAQDRKSNRERLSRHRALDQERREAAGRRLALTGDAGITEEQLAELVPDIDVENDHITMIQTYDIVRLWEEPLDALLASLPAGCLGLALFGWRPPEMSPVTALERCAFTLRRALQAEPALDAPRAALSLAAIGAVFVDQDEVVRLLATMKLS